jgi:hypothetical protein
MVTDDQESGAEAKVMNRDCSARQGNATLMCNRYSVTESKELPHYSKYSSIYLPVAGYSTLRSDSFVETECFALLLGKKK